MTDGEVRRAIRDFVETELVTLARQEPLGDHDDLAASGIVDSLGIMDLVAFVESAFAIRVRDEDLIPENFASIAAIASFVSRCASRQRSPATASPR